MQRSPTLHLQQRSCNAPATLATANAVTAACRGHSMLRSRTLPLQQRSCNVLATLANASALIAASRGQSEFELPSYASAKFLCNVYIPHPVRLSSSWRRLIRSNIPCKTTGPYAALRVLTSSRFHLAFPAGSLCYHVCAKCSRGQAIRSGPPIHISPPEM